MEVRIARKYARALFALATRNRVEEAVWADLSALAEVLRADRRLLKVLAAPQIPDEDKRTLVRAVMAGAHESVLHFLLFVIDKGRTEHIPRIIDLYGAMLDESRGILEAEITSAVPLRDDEIRRIVARLEATTGKTIRHRDKVDPAILGGVVIIVGGEIIDHSVRHDLLRLRETLRALKVHQAA